MIFFTKWMQQKALNFSGLICLVVQNSWHSFSMITRNEWNECLLCPSFLVDFEWQWGGAGFFQVPAPAFYQSQCCQRLLFIRQQNIKRSFNLQFAQQILGRGRFQQYLRKWRNGTCNLEGDIFCFNSPPCNKDEIFGGEECFLLLNYRMSTDAIIII